jgi:hypothetical protein
MQSREYKVNCIIEDAQMQIKVKKNLIGVGRIWRIGWLVAFLGNYSRGWTSQTIGPLSNSVLLENSYQLATNTVVVNSKFSCSV